jgi:hypothetical protein
MAGEMEILRPGEEMSVTAVNVAEMDAYTRSSINMQIEFAQNHPRKMDLVLAELESLSCRSEEVAEATFYTLKRKDKDGNTKLIQGPSVRFAEMLVYCWRNTRSDKGISGVDNEFVTGQGIMFDLERNNALKVETKRRITGRDGKRYNADMIQTTGNASSSLSYRNAVTSVIPQALWMPILEKAKKVAVGGTASVNERRNAALEYGKKVGVSSEQIFTTLNIQGINDIGIDELVTLKGLFNALKEGEMTIEDAFGDPYEKELTELFDKLGYNKGRRDVLIGNHKGQSVKLLDYLRKQAEPLGETAKTDAKPDAKPESAKEETPTAAQVVESEDAKHDKNQKADATEVKRGRGRPPKDKTVEPIVTPTHDALGMKIIYSSDSGTMKIPSVDIQLSKDLPSDIGKTRKTMAEEKPVEVKEKPAENKPEPDAGSFNF